MHGNRNLKWKKKFKMSEFSQICFTLSPSLSHLSLSVAEPRMFILFLEPLQQTFLILCHISFSFRIILHFYFVIYEFFFVFYRIWRGTSSLVTMLS